MKNFYKIFLSMLVIVFFFFTDIIQRSLAANLEVPNPIGTDTFEELVRAIATWIFNLSIPIAVIVIIYAGVLMLSAGGNPGRFKKGAEALKYAIIGLAVVLIGEGFIALIRSIINLRN